MKKLDDITAVPLFSHYSAKGLSIDQLKDVEPHDNDHAGSCKPNGLWLSCDNGGQSWESWCRAENFGTGGRYTLRQAVTLRSNVLVGLGPPKGVLHICGAYELDNFAHVYGMPLFPGGRPRENIDWARVGRDYDGIVITPYVWSRRLNAGLWYYGWDCASACIWRPKRVIKSIGPTEVVDWTKEDAEENYSDE